MWWHHKRGFRGRGIFPFFWIILFIAIFTKSGFSEFLIPMILFWVLVPMLFKGGKRHEKARRRPAMKSRPGPNRRSREPERTPSPAPSIEVQTRTPARDLSALPGHCRACGGPADGTTVRWRGDYAVCGYCGTGLQG